MWGCGRCRATWARGEAGRWDRRRRLCRRLWESHVLPDLSADYFFFLSFFFFFKIKGIIFVLRTSARVPSLRPSLSHMPTTSLPLGISSVRGSAKQTPTSFMQAQGKPGSLWAAGQSFQRCGMRQTAAVHPCAVKPSAGQGSAWIPWQCHEWAPGDALSVVGAELMAEPHRTPLQGDVPMHRRHCPFGHRPPTPEEPLPSDS